MAWHARTLFLVCRRVLPSGALCRVFPPATSLSWVSRSSTLVPGYQDLPELQGASEEVRKEFSLEFASQREWNKAAVSEAMKRFQSHSGDSGSTPVQIGALTVRIQYLTDHMRKNRKDKDCLRRLIQLVHRRRRVLLYLKGKDFPRYNQMLEDLKIRPPTTLKYAQKRRK